MRVRHAIIGAFVTAALILIAPANTVVAQSEFLERSTANFNNSSDAPVKILIQKVSGIWNEESCLAPGDSDSFNFVQKVDQVSFFFGAGEMCRNAKGRPDRVLPFHVYVTTYTIRGQKGEYSVLVHH